MQQRALGRAASKQWRQCCCTLAAFNQAHVLLLPLAASPEGMHSRGGRGPHRTQQQPMEGCAFARLRQPRARPGQRHIAACLMQPAGRCSCWALPVHGCAPDHQCAYYRSSLELTQFPWAPPRHSASPRHVRLQAKGQSGGGVAHAEGQQEDSSNLLHRQVSWHTNPCSVLDGNRHGAKSSSAGNKARVCLTAPVTARRRRRCHGRWGANRKPCGAGSAKEWPQSSASTSTRLPGSQGTADAATHLPPCHGAAAAACHCSA